MNFKMTSEIARGQAISELRDAGFMAVAPRPRLGETGNRLVVRDVDESDKGRMMTIVRRVDPGASTHE